MNKHESSHVQAEKYLRIHSCYFLPNLKHDQKPFIRIPSLNVPEMRLLGTFKPILSNGYHGNGDRYKKFQLQFWLFISKFYDCAKFHYDQVAVINHQNFQFLFVSDHFNLCATQRLVQEICAKNYK